MKTINLDDERKRTRQPLYRPMASSRAESALFITLGLVSFAAIGIALVSGSIPAGSNQDPLADLGKLPMIRYVRSGQFVVDARTVAAMVHYFFEAEGAMATNVSSPWPIQKNVAMPTNTAPGRPRA
jgi:hypothetical protein